MIPRPVPQEKQRHDTAHAFCFPFSFRKKSIWFEQSLAFAGKKRSIPESKKHQSKNDSRIEKASGPRTDEEVVYFMNHKKYPSFNGVGLVGR